MNAPLLIELDSFLKQNNLELKSQDFDFITEITWKTSLELICKICGEEFNITTKQLLRPHPERYGKVCPRCSAEDNFIAKLNELYGENPYIFKSEFKGYSFLIDVECRHCGNVFTTSEARNLLLGRGTPKHYPCKQCAFERNYKKNIDELEDALTKKFGSCNYIFKTPRYNGIYSKTKIPVECKLCGNKFNVNPQNLLNPKNGKHYCKKCNKGGKA